MGIAGLERSFDQRFKSDGVERNGLFHFYSIQGDGSKILGGPSKGIFGRSRILEYFFKGGKVF